MKIVKMYLKVKYFEVNIKKVIYKLQTTQNTIYIITKKGSKYAKIALTALA
jgi:hypothetical protein